jgi:hypothetical protein
LIDHALMFRLEFDGHDSNLAQLHRSYGETFGVFCCQQPQLFWQLVCPS